MKQKTGCKHCRFTAGIIKLLGSLGIICGLLTLVNKWEIIDFKFIGEIVVMLFCIFVGIVAIAIGVLGTNNLMGED